ncbi:MAG: preprotein translocase subunit SecY, partial [Leadbetterella sp.]
MNKFITTLKNIWSIEELRNRILTTLLIIVVYRIGSHVSLPGIDVAALNEANANAEDRGGLLGLLDTFVGGAFSQASIMALGIMPYISASIAVQLLGLALPYFSKLQKEGESGRRKLNQITRWLTIAFTGAQSVAYLSAELVNKNLVTIDHTLFYISGVLLIVSGTMMAMWLGERITEKGIGNGISMIIMIGIVSRFPASIFQEFTSRSTGGGVLWFVIEIVVFFLVIMFAVAITQATRRIPVQYASQVVGNKVATGQRQFLPLKLNMSGVMPIIFGQAIMFIPGFIASLMEKKSETAANIAVVMNNPASWQYNVLFFILIIAFTFFYTAISVNPNQISDDMKRGGGFVPGVKPGQDTSDFVANVLDRITLPGAVLLGVIAILPMFASYFGIQQGFASFFGGTSLLILVGVV